MRSSLRRTVLAAVVLAGGSLLVPASSSADTTGPACSTSVENAILCITVSDTPDPVSYSSTDGNITYLHYDATVTNTGTAATDGDDHVALIESLPAGTTYVAGSASTTQGSCTAAGTTVTCDFGNINAGAGVDVQLTVTSPATNATNPPASTITNTLTANTYDGKGTSHVEQTVTTTSTTTVTGTAGQTYIPQGTNGQVDTDPTAPQYANVQVTNANVNTLAALTVEPRDNFCFLGQVTLTNGHLYVCRSGGFVHASVTNADTGAEYFDATDPLVFHLRWAKSQVSFLQTVRNFVVFYKSTSTGTLQVFTNRCNATASNTPCLRNIVKASDGSWSVDLVKPDNGFMR